MAPKVVTPRLLMGIILVILVGVLAALAGLIYAQSENSQRDADLHAAQVAGCLRLKDAVTDFNAQYGEILKALIYVQRTHPGEPVTGAVIRAFRSPDFPLVMPPRCDSIHIY